jgi:hypothetical protein
MPQVQEMLLQAPTMMCDRFFVEKQSKQYQRWKQRLYDGDEIEFYYEDESAWLKGVVHSWHIDDGSGNAPGADAHFFLVLSRVGKQYKYELHSGLRVRLEAPTDAELIATSKWCEGGDWYDRGTHMPEEWQPCSKEGRRYLSPSGQATWYCDEHKPEWATVEAN